MIEFLTKEDIEYYHNELILLNARIIQMEKDFKELIEELREKDKKKLEKG